MKKTVYYAFVLLIAAVVSIESYPRPVAADGGASDESRPVRLYATATGPIGKVGMNFFSKSALAINGREVQGEQYLWGGELLQAPANRPIRVSFDSIGQVTLARGAVARFATSRAESDASATPVLVASLIAGDMKVKLDQQAGAFVEVAGSAYAASLGASFNIGINEGEVMVDTLAGSVDLQQQPGQRRYVVRPVGVGANISVRARATRQIQVQVTDENDNPVPDLPVIFLLGGGGGQFAGSIGSGTSVTVTTDSQGIANTTFTAGGAAGSNTITATVVGTSYSWSGSISVTQVGFWTLRNRLIVMGAAAAAAGTGLAISAASGDDEDLRPVPPPDVRP
ncbi:MAG TPA: hypothetical protein VLD57_04730 [Blastocatellia bacterium]|nr:hypothetical protein [Blastocatellia bacterium]